MSSSGYSNTLKSTYTETELNLDKKRYLRELEIQISEVFYSEPSLTFCYDPRNDQWSRKNPLPLRDTDKKSHFEMFVRNGKLHVIGRKGRIPGTHIIYSYDEGLDEWQVINLVQLV